jgi:hypothetical protein
MHLLRVFCVVSARAARQQAESRASLPQAPPRCSGGATRDASAGLDLSGCVTVCLVKCLCVCVSVSWRTSICFRISRRTPGGSLLVMLGGVGVEVLELSVVEERAAFADTHSLHRLLMRLCSHICDSPHSLHSLLTHLLVITDDLQLLPFRRVRCARGRYRVPLVCLLCILIVAVLYWLA